MSRKYDNYIDYLNNTIRIPEEQPYLAIDMFAGCGGLSLGFKAAGVKTIGYEMVAKKENDYIEVTFPEQFKTIRFPYHEVMEHDILKVLEV